MEIVAMLRIDVLDKDDPTFDEGNIIATFSEAQRAHHGAEITIGGFTFDADILASLVTG